MQVQVKLWTHPGWKVVSPFTVMKRIDDVALPFQYLSEQEADNLSVAVYCYLLENTDATLRPFVVPGTVGWTFEVTV